MGWGPQVSTVWLVFSQRLHTREILRIAVDDNTKDGGDDLKGKQYKEDGED